jgi:rare lipoprotein A
MRPRDARLGDNAPMRRLHLALVTLALAVLAGCSSAPKKSPGSVAARSGPAPSAERDGPERNPPPDLYKVPDAEPKVEPIRAGGPNKPYEVLGRDYTPEREDKPMVERGLASWYGKKFHGRRTASGEVYNMYAMTAAHKTMPIPSYARVRNPKNGKEVIVRVNDRGPFHADRVIDLSYTAALKLGVLHGVSAVEVERITHEDIRTGAWRRGDAPATPGDPFGESAPALAVAPAKPVLAAAVPVAAEAVSPTVALMSPGASSESNRSSRDDAPAAAQVNAAMRAEPKAETRVDAKPETARASTPAARGFWVQLGAFRQREGAEDFQRRVAGELDWLSPLLAVFSEPSLFRLQAGPYPSKQEANDVVARVRDALKLVPVVVERR